MNILLLVGIKLDAEVLRAKELQMGYDSERMIQAPPRSSTAAQKYAEVQTKLEKTARDIKDNAQKQHEEEKDSKRGKTTWRAIPAVFSLTATRFLDRLGSL